MLLALIFILFAITMPTGPLTPDPPLINDTNVTVAVGESQRVAIGRGNDSIGHNYYITDGETSEYALLIRGKTDTDPGCKPGGCAYENYVEIQGLKPGTFEFVVQYCFRTSLEECETDGKEPVTYTVTVVDEATGPSGPDVKVEVRVGEVSTVSIGGGNASIGDSFHIVEGEDSPNFTLDRHSKNTNPGCAPGGCHTNYYVNVTGVQPGTSEFVVQYCYRSAPPNCETQGKKPLTYRVVVTE